MANCLFENKCPKTEKKFFCFSFLIAGIGVLLSLYATWHHLLVKSAGETKGFACNVNDVISCDKIALSQYSEFASIPLGVWGIGFFVTLLMLLFSSCSSSDLSRRKASIFFYSILVIVGALVSVALAIISFSIIKAYCLICISIYFTCFALLALFLYCNRGFSVKDLNSSNLLNSSLIAAGSLLSVLVLFHISKTVTSSSAPKVVASQEGHHGSDHTGHSHGDEGKEKKVHEISLSTNPYMGKGEDFRKGDDQASVVIHEFVDFECPACRMASNAIKEMIKKYDGQVLLVFRNFPLDMSCNDGIKRPFHATSCASAKLARCSGRVNKFWEFHDLAFSEQEGATIDRAREWASKVGLSESDINKCLQDKFVLDKVRDDISLGEQLGVSGTPAIFVNGQKFEGPFGALEALVQRLLAARH